MESSAEFFSRPEIRKFIHDHTPKPIEIRRWDVLQVLNDDGVWRDYLGLRTEFEFNYARANKDPEKFRWLINGKPYPLDADIVWHYPIQEDY